ncbi:MAG: hypothetical protein ACLQJR_30100 [Stellaceae bacterium]
MKIRSILEAALTACVVAQPAAAASYNGDNPFICATLKIVSCEPSGECSQETAESINLPEFLRFDVPDKKISGERPNGEALATAIDSVRHVENTMALQGVEGHIVWSVMIAENTGDMTLTAAGDGTGYVAFGACTMR